MKPIKTGARTGPEQEKAFMNVPMPPLRRRHMLGVLAGLSMTGPIGRARAADGATLLVAGPDGGMLDRWSRVIQTTLAQALPPNTDLRRQSVGGADGVTAANQFDARTEPDGHTVLLAPGEAALAWLVGDPRARFDLTRWVSVLAGVTPGLIVARAGAIAPGKRVRVPTAGPASADLPGLLALELLGAKTELVPAIKPEALGAAFGSGKIDAVVLRGYHVPGQAQALATAGAARPVFSLGALDEAGHLVRCIAFPELPSFPETYAAQHPGAAPAVLAAWQAAAVAAQTDFALILPHLTPADMVAMWRHAGSEAAASLDMQALATELGIRTVGGAAAAATAGGAVANQTAVTALRNWLADRYKWKAA